MLLVYVIILSCLATRLIADPYADRREALRAKVAEGIAVIRGTSGEEYETRGQRSDLLYLTGIDQPDAVLVLIPHGKRLYSRGKNVTEVLYLPKRDTGRERWTGKKLGPGKEAEEATGISKVSDIARLDSQLSTFLEEESTLYFSGDIGNSDGPLTGDQVWINNIKEHNPFITVKDLSPLIARMRQVKDDGEIKEIRRAIDITHQAILKAMRVAGPGVYEYQVEAALLYEFRYLGADGPSFPPIVGSGPNSTVLHYDRNDRRMKDGDILILDVGAQYHHYAADITRTIPVSGKFSPEQAKIYDIVLEAQRRAIEAIRPGALYRDDVDAAARNYIEEKGYGEYFIHGTGHFVGLDVHDAGSYSVPLEPGMVLTVEPGIYIPEKEIGVRIEDMVLVTEGGHEVLSKAIPKSREEIEGILKGGSTTHDQ
jgi:Xaa-Pro aminopeptidase